MALTTVAFLLGFLILCGLALVRHPIYGLLAYVAVYYLNPPVRWWGVLLRGDRWQLVAAGLTVLAVLVSGSRRQRHVTPLMKNGVLYAALGFLVWIAIQSAWALDPVMQQQLLVMTSKYVLLIGLMYVCVDSEEHLKLFLWAHVLGCVYLGWIAHGAYQGGRFEDFGASDLNEANAGALQTVTGIFVASALFLTGKLRQRVALTGGLPFIVNALVATVSRSGFLAAACGGVMFNYFTPARFRKAVVVLSGLAIVLFGILSNRDFWTRMSSMEYAGTAVQGLDTGSGRLVLLKAQWRMFLDNPLGCGHRCTATLSPSYLPDKYLTGEGANRERSSHNTFMTLLVEQGVPGGLFYLALLFWFYRSLRILWRRLAGQAGFLPTLLPAIGAVVTAITVGDLFVDYAVQEVRVWFIGVIMVMLAMTQPSSQRPPGRGDRTPASAWPARRVFRLAAPPAAGGSETRSGSR